VVVTATRAQTHAARIESDHGQEHDIEPARTDDARALRLCYSETVGTMAVTHFHELHPAPEGVPIDAWQIDPAAAPACETEQRLRVELFRERGVHSDPPPWPQVQPGINVAGHELSEGAAFGWRQRAPLGSQRGPQRFAGTGKARCAQSVFFAGSVLGFP